MDQRLEVLAPFFRRLVHQEIEGLEVAARHEVIAGAADHQATHRWIFFDLRQGRQEILDHGVIEGVQRFRPVQGERGDAVLDFGGEGLAHVSIS